MSATIKEEAYRILFENQFRLLGKIRLEIKNRLDYGKDLTKDEMEFLNRLTDHSKYDYNGIQSKSDQDIFNTLQRLVEVPDWWNFHKKIPNQ